MVTNQINTLESGRYDLILADQNETRAEYLALKTRQKLQFSTLSPQEIFIVDLL